MFPASGIMLTSMFELRTMMSKKMAFILFNVGSIAYVTWKGDVGWDVISIVSLVVTLLIMNGVLWISARNFKDWKW